MSLPPAARGSSEKPLTVLYIVHGHAAERPGGAETYALELYEAARRDPHVEPVLLAATGPGGGGRPSPHCGTLVEPVGGDPAQYFFHTDAADYDWFLSTAKNKDIYTRHLADFLNAYRPDVVHVQHSLFFGFDLLRQIRRTLPDAPLIYTLHEYLPMCHRDGQLLRADGRRCPGPKPRDCAACFPDITPQDFYLRERFIKGALDLVDLFVCPSQFLLEKYAAWGIPRERLVMEENGRVPVSRYPSADDRQRNRVGYFGQFTRYKGADVLMEAVSHLNDRAATGRVQPSVVLHGANLEHAPKAFQQTFHDRLRDTEDRVRLHGRYRPDELPRLLADVDWVVVPSIWYENAPLVIQEAFQHGRPVICSDIGGMAEKVTDGVDGLHFRAGDARHLAEVLDRAVNSPGLWERLASGVSAVHEMDVHLANLTALYRGLLGARSSGLTATDDVLPTSAPEATQPQNEWEVSGVA